MWLCSIEHLSAVFVLYNKFSGAGRGGSVRLLCG